MSPQEKLDRYDRLFEFLDEVNVILTNSTDMNALLRELSKVAIHSFADLFIVDLYPQFGKLTERVLIAGKDSHDQYFSDLTNHKWPINFEATEGLSFVIRTGQAKLYSQLTAQAIAEMHSGHFNNVSLDKSATIIVPLKYYGRVFGVISFISHTQIYDEFDLKIALEIAKRTSFALENVRLFAKANEARQAKDVFLTNVSHEIRTPLTSILGFAELLQADTTLTAENSKYVTTIKRNGDRLLRIVNEILAFSKSERFSNSLVKTEFSLPELIDTISILLAIKAQDKKIDFQVTTNLAENELVICDSYYLRQIFTHVIDNAIKFTKTGSVHVDVRTREYSPNVYRVECLVTDTGIGLSAEEIKQLFVPFGQVDASLTRQYGGTGLGLFLARKLARELNGNVELVRSEPGKGSAFLAYADINYTESHIDKIIKNQVYSHTYLNGHDQQETLKPEKAVAPVCKTVLVVDDSSDIIEYISLSLANLNLDIHVAANGREAIEQALQYKPDVILMDIQMPEMNGIEATKSLRQLKCSAVIIALTAHAMRGDREKFLALGFDDYLSKPISSKDLSLNVSKYLKSSSATQQEFQPL